MRIDLKPLDGTPQSWNSLLPHVLSTLEGLEMPADYETATVEAIYEELPTLTDAMLAQIPWGMRFIDYVTLVAVQLDPENRYRFLRPNDLGVLRTYLKGKYFMEVHNAIIRPLHRPSNKQANAMLLLATAYAKRGIELLGLEIELVTAYVPVKLSGFAGSLLGVAPTLMEYVLWAPPIEEVPNDLADLARRTNHRDRVQWSRLIIAASTWLSGHPKMVGQDEQIRNVVAELTIHRLLS